MNLAKVILVHTLLDQTEQDESLFFNGPLVMMSRKFYPMTLSGLKIVLEIVDPLDVVKLDSSVYHQLRPCP